MFEYAPIDIICQWGGLTFTGFHDGTFVSGERDEDIVMKHAGSQGDITATMNASQAGAITLTLTQGSESNAELFAAVELQERTRKLQRKTFSITDLAGTLLVTAPNAWIRKPARAEFAKEVVGREWIFDCDKLLYLPPTPLR